MRSGTWCSTSQPSCRSSVHHQGRAARAVDVVIAEHADRLAVLHRIGEPIGSDVHIDQHGRVGQQRAQRRIEEVASRIDVDAARREQATHDFRHADALSDAETDTVLAATPHPAPATQTTINAENAVAHDGTADEHR